VKVKEKAYSKKPQQQAVVLEPHQKMESNAGLALFQERFDYIFDMLTST